MEKKVGQCFNVLSIPNRRAFITTVEQETDFRIDKKIIDVDSNLNVDDKIIEKQYFDVLAVPSNKAFIVDKDKKEEFLSQKADPEVIAQMRANAFKLNVTNATEKGPVLVKKRRILNKT